MAATLAHRLGIEQVVDELVDLGDRPSTLGTFPRAFTFGHIRQLDRVAETVLGRVWGAGAGPGQAPMTIDVDSTIYEVHGHHKGGAAYGYTRQLGYHPLLATRADTGEMLHIRMRKGSANSARGPSGSSTSWLAGYGGPARLGSLPCGPARASGPPRS